MLILPGPHFVRGECTSDRPYREIGKEPRQRAGGESEGRVFADAVWILPRHPLHGAVPRRHPFDLPVRPRGLHAAEGAAEAHRGCAQRDHDVLVARVTFLRDFDTLLIKTAWNTDRNWMYMHSKIWMYSSLYTNNI